MFKDGYKLDLQSHNSDEIYEISNGLTPTNQKRKVQSPDLSDFALGDEIM